MKTQHYPIDYAIYIDDRQSFIITVDHNRPEYPVIETVQREQEDADETGFVNALQEHIRQLCNEILERLGNAHSLLIFGPTEAKYALRDTLRSSGNLVIEEQEHLVTTDPMTEEEALRFSQSHLTYESNVTKLS